ncbi:Ribosomal protein S12 [Quillaja saponaria]|uniref:Ribosomal protein S12 n=1 Tax=Quillaja saponaria TaxID=32244 RepID=A0AAD7QA97_QUISA|nr:Ribosomal protein S12 [Quillaja saponaria]
MGGNNRQRKTSNAFSFFKFLKSKKPRGGYDAYDDGSSAWKVWTSDEDRGRWGVAEPDIDRKAEAFIAQYKKRVTESELHCHS